MYSDHYGLSARPFQLTPDPHFYFDSATHRKAMAYLGYGLAQGEGFIVITGDIGTGKTTLVAHLMATIDTERLTAIKVVSTQIEGDDMLRMAAQAMGIDTERAEKAQILERIERFLIGEAHSGKRTLLIVDEAQNLPASSLEELRMLSNFQAGGQALLQIFLLGQPEFREKLNGTERLEQLRQRVIATHHLEPMDASEIEPYITHRLTRAGWQGTPRFTQDAYSAMYAHSDGVPRRLNALASRVLLHGAIEQLTEISGEVVHAVVSDIEADTPAPRTHGTNGTNGANDVHNGYAGSADAASTPSGKQDEALLARIKELEERLEEQDIIVRRMLSLLIDWVERDRTTPDDGTVRGAA